MTRRDVSTPQRGKCLPCLRRCAGRSTRSLRRSLLALPYPARWSGAQEAVARCGKWCSDTPPALGLSALLIVLGAIALGGCYLTRTLDQATASDVNNRNFTFSSGAVFHNALANVSTGLAFSNNAQTFTLCSGSATATGTNRFGSCTLTVTDSTYNTGSGPQEGDVIQLDPCDFDSDFNTLTVSRGSLTATSAAATTNTTCSSTNQATPSQLDNQSFTFGNGGVFNTALSNVQTALAFSNNARNFTLTSAGSVSGTASGTSTIAGSCTLTVTSSTYGLGPQRGDVITLSPCTYDSGNNTLMVTNLGLTATSAPGQVQ